MSDIEITDRRITWIDSAKGIGIILVVLAHTFWGGRTIIYTFHMPLFFFISGALYHRRESLTFIDSMKRRINSLLKPYILFSVISPFLQYTLMGINWPLAKVSRMILLGIRGGCRI